MLALSGRGAITGTLLMAALLVSAASLVALWSHSSLSTRR